MKKARIVQNIHPNDSNLLAVYLSDKEAGNVVSHMEQWQTYIYSLSKISDVCFWGRINRAYTNDEIVTGLTKVLEGLGYEVRS
jgi:hypothetical protein